MAKKKATDHIEENVPKGFRSFKTDTRKFYELRQGQSIAGVFLGVRTVRIKDKRTKLPKDIQVYRIRQEDDSIESVGGRAMLDQQFHDAIDELYGGNPEAARGARIIINRGEDKRTSDNNPMGTYELLLEDPKQVEDEN